MMRTDLEYVELILAQEFLALPDHGRDDELMEESFKRIRAEVRAGRINQQEFPAHARDALKLLGGIHSRKIEPSLTLLKGGAA